MKLWHKLASALPACQEKISYGMQTLFWQEDGYPLREQQVLPWDLSLPENDSYFWGQGGSSWVRQGTLQFPYDSEIPYDLTVELAVYNYHQQK